MFLFIFSFRWFTSLSEIFNISVSVLLFSVVTALFVQFFVRVLLIFVYSILSFLVLFFCWCVFPRFLSFS